MLINNLSKDRQADRSKRTDFARRALEDPGDDPAVLVNVANALAYFGEDIHAMINLADRALTLNPNYARGWHIAANLRLWAGQPDAAVEFAKTALRLSPCARVGSTFLIMGAAFLRASL
jgi:tetratricopeptide (TPR) repeat protein